jgi:hypothetical protein
MLHALFAKGMLEPWQPLAAWFGLCARYRVDLPATRQGKASFDIFGIHRVLAINLAEVARTEMGDALRNMRILYGELRASGYERQLDQHLAQIKKTVLRDCKQGGCLMLSEIISQKRIREANFSRYWRIDNFG